MAKILDGTALAQEIRGEAAVGVAEMLQKHQVTPGLAGNIVQVRGVPRLSRPIRQPAAARRGGAAERRYRARLAVPEPG